MLLILWSASILARHRSTIVMASSPDGCWRTMSCERYSLLPCLGSLGAHPTGNRSLRNIETQHQKLTVDARRSQLGFSATMRKINSRTSFGVCLRPSGLRTLEISFQYNRKPVRCHRTTVSGVTTIRACFHRDQNLRSKTQNSFSNNASLGLERLRFNATSCWRSAGFRGAACDDSRSRRIAPAKSTNMSIICEC